MLEEPLHLYELPSDESDNEDNNEEHITFKSICDEIYDNEYLKTIEDEDMNEKNNQIKNNAHPFLMFKTFLELSSINDVLNYYIKFHLCYDKRELKNYKIWYCVVFRRDYNNNKNNNKFEDIIKEIYDKIECKKKIITIDMNGNIYNVRGNIFYSAIRVNNFNEAINLCIKYKIIFQIEI